MAFEAQYELKPLPIGTEFQGRLADKPTETRVRIIGGPYGKKGTKDRQWAVLYLAGRFEGEEKLITEHALISGYDLREFYTRVAAPTVGHMRQKSKDDIGRILKEQETLRARDVNLEQLIQTLRMRVARLEQIVGELTKQRGIHVANNHVEPPRHT